MPIFATAARAALFGGKQNTAITLGSVAKANALRMVGRAPKDAPTLGGWVRHVWSGKAAQPDKLPSGWPADVFAIVAKEIESKAGTVTLEDGLRIPAFRLVASGAATLPHIWAAYIKPTAASSKYRDVLGLGDSIEESLAQKGHNMSARILSRPLRIEIERPDAAAVKLTEDWELLKAQPVNRYEYLFGAYFDGRGLKLGIADMLDSNECHAVIGGMTGSGKSQVSLMILLSAMLNTSPEKLAVVICDPKNKDFRPLNNLVHNAGVVFTEVGDCKAAILAVLAEMDKRTKAGDDAAEYKRILLYIDELPDLLDQDDDGAIEAALIRLAQKGRAWGINIIIAAQKATAEVFSSRLLDNMPWRMVLRVANGVQSRHLSGNDECLAHKLPGKGAGLFYNAQFPDGVRVQGHLVSLAGPDYARNVQRFVADINERWAGIRPHWTAVLADQEEEVAQQATLFELAPTASSPTAVEFELPFALAMQALYQSEPAKFTANRIRTAHTEHYGQSCRQERARRLYDMIVAK